MRCHFLPPYLLEQIARAEGLGVGADVVERCREALAVDRVFREERATATAEPPPADAAAWTVHTAENQSTLPGTPVRSAGDADSDSGDVAVDEAADGITATLALFAEAFGRTSYDGDGAPVSLTVHYRRGYVNAFWDGRQLVFGDGDGELFDRFTKPVDVLGHEFTHAVTEHTAGLVYSGQSGALNESLSDVFAACLKQRLLGQTAEAADWLIGEGLFLPGVEARALRDMRAPGTAYDDPRLGKDPQGGHMDDYVDTTDDNGGVHLNSGIPNRAFALAATAIGGTSWEGAGRIWYAALTGPDVAADSDFAAFAAATVNAAGDHADKVREAWATVGVAPPSVGTGALAQPSVGARGSEAGAPAEDSAAPEAANVTVRRSGGFIGRTTSGEVDLDGDDPRAEEIRELVARIDLRAARGGNPHPDMYTYEFRCGDQQATVPEQHLTDDLRRLADLVLRADR